MFAIVAAILAFIFALGGTVVAFIFIMPESRRPTLPQPLAMLHDILNFKSLLLEYIMKALYVINTLFVLIYGFFLIFTFSAASFVGLGMMIIGPIIVRVIYEGCMMFILLVKNTIEINKKMNG